MGQAKWISRGLNRGGGWANLSKKEKTNGLVGAKHRGGAAQPKEKKKQIDKLGLRKKEKTNGFFSLAPTNQFAFSVP